eukprot:COSAG01_NODE_2659_length_7299_cov_34.861111_6_plen_114_part_00
MHWVAVPEELRARRVNRAAGVPAWSAEDYSTYSDATGAGCWGRLLVQNMGWELSATISWYLLGSFARGMDYDSDGSKFPRPIRSSPRPQQRARLCAARCGGAGESDLSSMRVS